MQNFSYHILRLGMALTFLWIGALILQQPEAWGGYLPPWAAGLLPISLRVAMVATAVLDLGIGIFLLINIWVWQAALLGALHIAGVLIISGVNAITVRDIGLFAASAALAATTWPDSVRFFWVKL